ncbi:MAG: tRNA (adenosine(37)-N6)-threonylcarbamoyltransferase complex ATPase subunit type 1 TsaE, partial [Minisyncoccia bacterium]
MEKTYTTKNASDMGSIATEFVAYIQALPAQNHALVVALTGDLGAGKTTFIQNVASVLGITENINSPTFVILKKYLLPQIVGVFTELVHIDAYRLADEAELEKIRFNDYYNNPNAILCIEWPEIV